MRCAKGEHDSRLCEYGGTKEDFMGVTDNNASLTLGTSQYINPTTTLFSTPIEGDWEEQSSYTTGDFTRLGRF
jgi:hypothetical protein